MRLLPRLLLLLLLVFPATVLFRGGPKGSLAVAQDLTEDEETVEDSIIEDEDDEAEVEEDEPTDLVEDKEEEDVSGEPEASPSADTTILFVKGEDFPANNIVKFLVGFTNKGTEDFIVESLDASFRYPQDYQFYIQNFTALPLNTVVPPQRQATFEYSFIPAEPMGGRPFGLVINLNYKDLNGNVFQDAVFNQTVTVIEREDGLDGETIFMYMFLAGLGLLVIVGLHQLLESRKSGSVIQDGVQRHNLGLLQPPPSGLKSSSHLIFLSSRTTGARHHTQLIFVCFVETGFRHVAQAGLELLGSSCPLMLVSQSVGIVGMSHHTQPSLILLIIETILN
ncbi:translocon-associated protein subunit alpha isoform X1 [Gorilla gorilla gorilla]|uniref:translocon-associated protein subunit alpha isoform X1 n=1 Tax=Gorilla gorilla gorilla TaxID=9595 RepID=UPI00300ADCF2